MENVGALAELMRVFETGALLMEEMAREIDALRLHCDEHDPPSVEAAERREKLLAWSNRLIELAGWEKFVLDKTDEAMA